VVAAIDKIPNFRSLLEGQEHCTVSQTPAPLGRCRR
jgi:hypothetical protein